MSKSRFRYRKPNIFKSRENTPEKKVGGVFSLFKLNIILIIIIILAAGLIIFYSPIFTIQTDKINFETRSSFDTSSIESVINEHMNSYYLFVIPRKNILVFDDIFIENAFSDHPYIHDLDIRKKLLHTLEITYKLRDPEFIITNNTDYFLVDISGFVLAKLDTTKDYEYLPQVLDKIASFNVGDKINYQTFLPTIQTIWNQIQAKFDDFNISSIELFLDSAELRVYTNEGWYVLFNLQDDIDHQLRVLDKVLHDNITDRSELDYVDLRVSDWVYYQ